MLSACVEVKVGSHVVILDLKGQISLEFIRIHVLEDLDGLLDSVLKKEIVSVAEVVCIGEAVLLNHGLEEGIVSGLEFSVEDASLLLVAKFVGSGVDQGEVIEVSEACALLGALDEAGLEEGTKDSLYFGVLLEDFLDCEFIFVVEGIVPEKTVIDASGSEDLGHFDEHVLLGHQPVHV